MRNFNKKKKIPFAKKNTKGFKNIFFKNKQYDLSFQSIEHAMDCLRNYPSNESILIPESSWQEIGVNF